ncbi:GT4 family glycosyltransferase PelF [Myxosarcina sp. GI1]|uniref:GT4 family glycosyltransferase PelF n=1 Tax=Myxosarcina sp. GI1 TaxID=1541065 RepID=UPI00056A7395|nr:GT4 family glycosyltransferase PelF [Myxosarcina sp. GI1]
MARPLVLLTTEGTYPFAKGGVSTWCHVLTHQLPEVDFKLLSIVANPYLKRHYELSSNVLEVIKIPLWGTDDPVEYSWRFPFSLALKSKLDNSDRIIKTRFMPLFETWLRAVLFDELKPEKLGYLLLAIHEYFLQYDYHQTMSSVLVWSTFRYLATSYCQKQNLIGVTLAELTEAMRLVYRLLIPIQVPVPETDITHSSAAAFCGLPCVIAKLQRNTPYLLTEHGINIREQYLNLNHSIPSLFVRKFLYCLMGAVVKLNFHFADRIAPVCEYNARWERWWGVPPEKIKVIYNGADPDKFHPTPPVKKERPQVMNMGLIFPLKGQLDLIEAAAVVREQVPNVEFRFYGKPSDEAYFAKCQESVRKHNLEETINFAGFTSEPWRAYSEADVVAMASISEGFPFAVIEAMLSGATIVSTDVGGVREAIADTGLLVRAGRPQQLAEAILKLLLLSPEERSQYGKKALERSLKLFTQKTFLAEHLSVYRHLNNK